MNKNNSEAKANRSNIRDSKRYRVTSFQVADLDSVTIDDTHTNKRVCHFVTENGFKEAESLATKIANFLNYIEPKRIVRQP